MVVAAVWAGSGYVAVGEELPGLGVVVLFGGFLYEFALFVECAEEIGGYLPVCVAGGSAVDVHGDAEVLERLLDDGVVPVVDVLRRDAFFSGPDGDGDSVFVGAADHDDLLSFGAEVADVDVGWDVDTGEVSDVYGSVGVGERGCDERPFVFC